MPFLRRWYENLAVVAHTDLESDNGSPFCRREVRREVGPLREHDDRVGGPTFRNRKGRGPFRGRMYSEQQAGGRQRHRGGGGGPVPRARLEDDDGDVDMNDSGQDSGAHQRRFTPYGGRPNRRGDNHYDRDRGGGGNAGGHRPGRGGPPRKSWFKMTIPYGKKYDKTWLLTALQGLCTVPFTPVQYHCEGNKVMFYVEDATTANALCKVSRKITDTEGYKVSVIMHPAPPPASVLNELKPEDLEHLKQCMSKRFDASQQALDLNSIRTDPDLVSQTIEVILNRRSCMQAINKIIEENVPELLSLNLGNNRLYKLDEVSELVSKVPNLKILNLSNNELKSERDLDKVKGFKLEELWLEHNPLCDHFKDQPSYISAIRERFPRLLRLDGHILPRPIAFDVEAPTTLPACKGSYFGSEEIKSVILRFLQQYYNVYDSGDRQPLLDAYHDGASFSLSIPFSLQNPSRCSLGDYHKDSRNIKKLKDPTTRFRLLKHTRLNVVAFLNELPKTQHDTSSFVVDVNTYTNTLLSFTISGVFKEVDEKSRDTVRAFSRVFITVPAGNAGLCIVNDELFVRNATTEEIRRAFATPAPTPSSSPVPTLTAAQQEMLSAFSLQSGMNLEWSQKCLQDNEWDFNRAAQIFSQLKSQGKIPDVAFK
ncbi:nuclear RNA export factor 1 isoform X1 [Amia ocellicauda]|uniref:nuclear RNA export factor 1 isoform X1 n=1 Tax=Amia ocellicauda TaxID=2972642 RepID=UPI003463C235